MLELMNAKDLTFGLVRKVEGKNLKFFANYTLSYFNNLILEYDLNSLVRLK